MSNCKTMDKANIARFKVRIKRAQSSMNISGDMMLSFDIDYMTIENALALRDGLLQGRTPVTYEYLNKRIAKLQGTV